MANHLALLESTISLVEDAHNASLAAKEAEISHCDSQLASLFKCIADREAEISHYDSQFASLSKCIADREAEIQAVNDKLAALIPDVHSISQMDAEISSLRARVVELEGRVDELPMPDEGSLNEQLQILREEEDGSDFVVKLINLLIDEVNKTLGDIAPLLEQPGVDFDKVDDLVHKLKGALTLLVEFQHKAPYVAKAEKLKDAEIASLRARDMDNIRALLESSISLLKDAHDKSIAEKDAEISTLRARDMVNLRALVESNISLLTDAYYKSIAAKDVEISTLRARVVELEGRVDELVKEKEHIGTTEEKAPNVAKAEKIKAEYTNPQAGGLEASGDSYKIKSEIKDEEGGSENDE